MKVRENAVLPEEGDDAKGGLKKRRWRDKYRIKLGTAFRFQVAELYNDIRE